MKVRVSAAVVLYILALFASAHAYVGPGLGAGTLAVVVGFIVSIFLAAFGIVWYPLKRLFRKTKQRQAAGKERDQE